MASAQDGKPSSSSASPAEAEGVPATQHWEWTGTLAENFLITAPPDLRQVWEMAVSLSPKDPCAAFESVGVTLCGPFDMMAGKLNVALAARRLIRANIRIVTRCWVIHGCAVSASSSQCILSHGQGRLSMSRTFRVRATVVPLCSISALLILCIMVACAHVVTREHVRTIRLVQRTHHEFMNL